MTSSSVFAVHPNILRFEEGIRYRSDAEITGFFSEDGILLLRLQGYCHSGEGCFTVIPEGAEGAISGQILTHNHPSDASFTRKDLREASFFRLKEIRVVGRTGIFSMRPGPDGWPSPREMVAKFDEIWEDPALATKVERMMQEKAGRDGDLPDGRDTGDAGRMRVRSDICCEQLAKDLHLRYRKACWPSWETPSLSGV